MQIIENSIVGTRSAVLRLTKRGGGPAIVIFPMLHVAEPQFYRDVEARLRKCDVLVVEGIQGDSTPVVEGLTMTYRVLPGNEEAGLVEDDIPYGDLGVPFVTPDLSAEQVQEGIQALPWKTRAVMWAAVPVASVSNFFAGRRALLSPDIEVNRPDDAIDIAVVYGARHVPGILRGVYRLGYRVVSAEWLMAVSAPAS